MGRCRNVVRASLVLTEPDLAMRGPTNASNKGVSRLRTGRFRVSWLVKRARLPVARTDSRSCLYPLLRLPKLLSICGDQGVRSSA
jgi:hypothetical protein